MAGLLITGAREWTDYQVNSTITPHLCARFGIGVRVQGLQRYYALLLCNDGGTSPSGGKARLIKSLDGETALSETDFAWEFSQPYSFTLRVEGTPTVCIQAWINDQLIADAQDPSSFVLRQAQDRSGPSAGQAPLTGGGIALVCTEGRIGTHAVAVQPV